MAETATLMLLAEMQTHVESSLADAALQTIMDAEEAEIVARYGAHGAADDTGPSISRRYLGDEKLIFLGQRAASITSIDETVVSSTGETTTTLSADDYQSWDAGRALRRLNSGTNKRDLWGSYMDVVFVGFEDRDRRKLVLINLVKLSVQYEAAKSSRIGDVQVSFPDYEAERNAILRTLAADYYVFT